MIIKRYFVTVLSGMPPWAAEGPAGPKVLAPVCQTKRHRTNRVVRATKLPGRDALSQLLGEETLRLESTPVLIA
jgi:hypothetical protein